MVIPFSTFPLVVNSTYGKKFKCYIRIHFFVVKLFSWVWQSTKIYFYNEIKSNENFPDYGIYVFNKAQG